MAVIDSEDLVLMLIVGEDSQIGAAVKLHHSPVPDRKAAESHIAERTVFPSKHIIFRRIAFHLLTKILPDLPTVSDAELLKTNDVRILCFDICKN